jgi:hypothetical protein
LLTTPNVIFETSQAIFYIYFVNVYKIKKTIEQLVQKMYEYGAIVYLVKTSKEYEKR